MSLAPGTRIGHYEILAPIGAGGMGEVFRARDTKLNRDVAIKMLPESVAIDPVRLARFEREARTLAAVNHAHIAQIYGLEDAGARGKALVMELVPGQTLAEHIADGRPLPIPEALEIARQIVDALECAHAEGIVHRDLKPANIKVRDDGTVKVLDFGLAKGGDSGAAANLQDSPTFTSPAMTERGMIMGTAAYMSPEQARGKPVDKRADIWAFGVIVFEMLTGKQMFAGETVSDTLAAVLREDVPWAALPAGTPPSLRRVLERCLQKDPKRRLRDIGDARLEIEDAIALRDVVPTADAPARRDTPSRLPWLVALAAGIGAAAVTLWALGRDRPAADGGWHAFTQLTDTAGEEIMPAISPDGMTVAYAAKINGQLDLFAQRVGGRNRVLIAADPQREEAGPAFSPDGQRIAFFELDQDGGIFVAGATGEAVRRVADEGYHPAWSPDGKQIAYITEEIYDPYSRTGDSILRILDLETGRVRTPIQSDNFDAAHAAFSPSGARLVFWSNTGGQRDLFTVAAAGGAPVPLIVDAPLDWCPIWSHDGKWVIFASDRGGSMNFWRVRVDEATGERRGEPEPVTTGVQAAAELGSLSADGSRLAFQSRVRSVNPVRIAFDPATGRIGQPEILDTSNSILVPSDVSPDGRWLSLSPVGQRQEDLFISPTSKFEPRRLMDDMARDRLGTWSADGRSLLFYSNRGGIWEAWSINADGGGLRKIGGSDIVYPMTSPRRDLYVWTDTGRGVYVSTIKPDGSAGRTDKLPGTDDFTATSWSTDGRLLTGMVVGSSGRASAVAVYDLATRSRKSVASDTTSWVRWLPDSRRVVYITSSNQLVMVDTQSGVRTVLAAALPLPAVQEVFALSPDGRTIYYGGVRSEADIWIAERPKK